MALQNDLKSDVPSLHHSAPLTELDDETGKSEKKLPITAATTSEGQAEGERAAMSDSLLEVDSGRERLTRHRMAVAGQVWIPEKWGKEELLKDWIDSSAFEASLFPSGIVSAHSARLALVREGKRSADNNDSNEGFRILNRC